MKHVYTRFFTFVLISSLLAGCGLRQKTAYKKSFSSRPEASPPASSSETAPVKSAAGSPVTLGFVEGNTYTNTYAGFGCDLDDDWKFYTAKELLELPYDIKEVLDDPAVSELTLISDMKAENIDGLSSINVMYTKLDTHSRLLYAVLSQEAALDAMLKQRDKLISSYAQAGIEVGSIEKVEVDFLGENQFAVHTSSTWNNIPYFTLQFYNYKAGLYGVTVTFASFFKDATETLAGLFYPVD